MLYASEIAKRYDPMKSAMLRRLVIDLSQSLKLWNQLMMGEMNEFKKMPLYQFSEAKSIPPFDRYSEEFDYGILRPELKNLDGQLDDFEQIIESTETVFSNQSMVDHLLNYYANLTIDEAFQLPSKVFSVSMTKDSRVKVNLNLLTHYFDTVTLMDKTELDLINGLEQKLVISESDSLLTKSQIKDLNEAKEKLTSVLVGFPHRKGCIENPSENSTKGYSTFDIFSCTLQHFSSEAVQMAHVNQMRTFVREIPDQLADFEQQNHICDRLICSLSKNPSCAQISEQLISAVQMASAVMRHQFQKCREEFATDKLNLQKFIGFYQSSIIERFLRGVEEAKLFISYLETIRTTMNSQFFPKFRRLESIETFLNSHSEATISYKDLCNNFTSTYATWLSETFMVRLTN